MAERIKVFGVRRALEAWLLADEEGVGSVLSGVNYRCKGKTDLLSDPKREVRRLYRKQYGTRVPYNEIEFARRMVCKVDFDRASRWSYSMKAFWDSVSTLFNTWR